MGNFDQTNNTSAVYLWSGKTPHSQNNQDSWLMEDNKPIAHQRMTYGM